MIVYHFILNLRQIEPSDNYSGEAGSQSLSLRFVGNMGQPLQSVREGEGDDNNNDDDAEEDASEFEATPAEADVFLGPNNATRSAASEGQADLGWQGVSTYA